MDKRKCRDYNKLFWSIMLSWLYIPHLLCVLLSYNSDADDCKCGIKNLIFSDIERMKSRLKVNTNKWLTLLAFLHTDSYYRSLFYYGIGPIKSLFISWYRPGNNSFIIPYSTKVSGGFCYFHPFSTILNAKSIGSNFSCGHNTTIGTNGKGRPLIGDNVAVGIGAILIGDIIIGNNVVIGAGSVVTKDIPDNATVAGNPAKIIRIK